MLRTSKLRVVDEISNVLGYYNITFFNEIPNLTNKFQEISKKLGENQETSPAISERFLRLSDISTMTFEMDKSRYISETSSR